MIIWSNNGTPGSQWSSTILHKFDDVVWHVSWSLTGDILAVSGGNNKVRFFIPCYFIAKLVHFFN